MMSILLTVLVTYIIVSLFGYVVHWTLHQKWAGLLNSAHMTHHLELYPPEDFTSDTYRDAGQNSALRVFAIAALPLILAPFVLWFLGIFSFGMVIAVLLVEGSVGFLNNYLHDAFHIKNHWLARTPFLQVIFGRWFQLHYLHHVDMGKNFGIFGFHWDRIFKTFWNDTHEPRQ
jgi:hypothetical protein